MTIQMTTQLSDIPVDTKVFYVSNKELFQHYLDWYVRIDEAKEHGLEKPPIPDAISSAMIKICTRLSYSYKFIRYTWREDMIADAIYDCVKFADKFNPTKSDNPFSYITTVAFRAFLRRIDKEKTEKYIKAQLISSSIDSDFLEGEDEEYVNSYVEYLKEVGYAEDSTPMVIKRADKKAEEKRNAVVEEKSLLEQFYE